MAEIVEHSEIQGVYIAQIKAFGDDRGRFMETFRKEWFPQRSWDIVQTNRSHSTKHVVRGLHYHFKQVDYWHVVQGTIRAGLVDIRPSSPTFGKGVTIELSGENPQGVFIPVGVAHGFATISDNVILTYIVDNYYDNSDEFGIWWNDPRFNLDWGMDTDQAILSGRDSKNPLLADVPLEMRPDLS